MVTRSGKSNPVSPSLMVQIRGSQASHILVENWRLASSLDHSYHLGQGRSLLSYANSGGPVTSAALAPSLGMPLVSVVKPQNGLLAGVTREINRRAYLSMPHDGSFELEELLKTL